MSVNKIMSGVGVGCHTSGFALPCSQDLLHKEIHLIGPINPKCVKKLNVTTKYDLYTVICVLTD